MKSSKNAEDSQSSILNSQQPQAKETLFYYPVSSERPVEPTAVQGESKLPEGAVSITATSNKHSTHSNTRLGLSKKKKDPEKQSIEFCLTK
jgi:hypothetical protein